MIGHDRFTEPATRRRDANQIEQMKRAIREAEKATRERDRRRQAAFAIAKALDLVDEIPIPSDLKREDSYTYSAVIEGRRWTVVQIATAPDGWQVRMHPVQGEKGGSQVVVPPICLLEGE